MTEIETYVGRNADVVYDLPRAISKLREVGYFNRIGKKYGFSEHDRDELIGETALRALDYLGENVFENRGGGLEGYVRLLFKRACLDELKSRGRMCRNDAKNIPIEGDGYICPKTAEGINYLITDESSQIIFFEIDRFPDDQRDQLLKDIYGYNSQKKSGAERAKLSRGKALLKERLTKLGVLEVKVD